MTGMYSINTKKKKSDSLLLNLYSLLPCSFASVRVCTHPLYRGGGAVNLNRNLKYMSNHFISKPTHSAPDGRGGRSGLRWGGL